MKKDLNVKFNAKLINVVNDCSNFVTVTLAQSSKHIFRNHCVSMCGLNFITLKSF